jgi:uncharacterized protein (TIGR03437 family)
MNAAISLRVGLKSNSIYSIYSALLAGMVLLATAQTAEAQGILGTNLVVNGGAEAGPAGSTTKVTTSIPGWTSSGSPNVLPYDITGLLQSNGPAPPDHGFQYFIAGSGSSILTQTIDVSSAASTISAGNVKFTASAYLGCVYANGRGTAEVKFAFENSSGQTFSTATVGPLGGTLDLQQQIGLVPSGTAEIGVTLTLTTNTCNGAADSISLVLSTLGTSPATVLGPNLVVNPGAEQGPGVLAAAAQCVEVGCPSSAIAPYVPGWSTAAFASVTPYGSNWFTVSDPAPSDRGVNAFWGPAGASMYQDLDVSAAATAIDGGKVTYQVSAWLGGLHAQSAVLTYIFFDWTGRQLAPSAQLGPANNPGSSLILTSYSDILPAGTRRINLTLTFPGGAWDTSLADDISFTLSPAGAPTISAGGVVPVYSSSTTIQPGSWGSIFGTNLAGTTTVWNGDFPLSLGGTSVTVNSKPAYLWFVSPTQINFQAPDDTATGSVNVVVTTTVGSYTSMATLSPYGPSFSLYNAKYAAGIVITPGQAGNSGGGYDIIGPSGAFAFASRPVKAGETLVLYGVGFGPTNPAVPAGAKYSSAAPCLTNPTVTIGGVAATVNFAGIVGAGLYQLNVVVPKAGSGDQLLQAIAGGLTTPANVYITLQ